MSREQDQEEEIKKVLSNAYINSDKDFILKSIDDAVALYGKIAITHLLNFSNTINDIELKNYIVTKIREIKSDHP